MSRNKRWSSNPWRTRPSSRGWALSRLKPLVLARDGGLCQLRLPGCTTVATELDHIVEVSKGGATTLDNLRAVCHPCHRQRHPHGIGAIVKGCTVDGMPLSRDHWWNRR